MTVENELAELSTDALNHMADGLGREMQRLAYAPELHKEREAEDWIHAAWKACAIMQRAVDSALQERR